MGRLAREVWGIQGGRSDQGEEGRGGEERERVGADEGGEGGYLCSHGDFCHMGLVRLLLILQNRVVHVVDGLLQVKQFKALVLAGEMVNILAISFTLTCTKGRE